jgi:phosphatidylinositol dimannoside acyltransferase
MFDLRGWLADTWTLSIAPGWPSYLPWPLAYACYRALARQRSLYADFASGATCAPEYIPIADFDAFLHDVRTMHLLDVADLALSRRKPVEWWPDQIDVVGEWPRSGAFVAVTFHYGTGLWICHALRHAGHRSMFLSGRFERDAFEARPLLHRYGTERLAEVERITGSPIAYRPGARETLLEALAQGVSVIGLIDVPPRLAPRGQRPVELLGRPASLPDGLLQLAADADVPIVPCWVELDFASGRRRVGIGEARAAAPYDATLVEIAATLDRLIRKSPAEWMFWREWSGWLSDAATLHADQ